MLSTTPPKLVAKLGHSAATQDETADGWLSPQIPDPSAVTWMVTTWPSVNIVRP